MRFRTLLAAALLVLTGLVAAPAVGSAAPAAPAAAAASCTKTSSGTCIKGDRNHPRWTKP